MKKEDAIILFGGKAVLMAKALKKSKSAISQWPSDLDNDQINMVIGAACRCGLDVPKKYLDNDDVEVQ